MTTRLSERPARVDAYPSPNYFPDRGCSLHPKCITCPFEVCRYDKVRAERPKAETPGPVLPKRSRAEYQAERVAENAALAAAIFDAHLAGASVRECVTRFDRGGEFVRKAIRNGRIAQGMPVRRSPKTERKPDPRVVIDELGPTGRAIWEALVAAKGEPVPWRELAERTIGRTKPENWRQLVSTHVVNLRRRGKPIKVIAGRGYYVEATE